MAITAVTRDAGTAQALPLAPLHLRQGDEMLRRIERPNLKKEMGSSLVLVMGVVLAVSLICGAITTVILHQIQSVTASKVRLAAYIAQATVINRIEDTNSWFKTLQANPAQFDCLMHNGRDCSGSTTWQSFELKDANGNSVTSIAGATTIPGFNLTGEPCAYSPTSSTCAFYYKLQWRVNCPAGGACTSYIQPTTVNTINGQSVTVVHPFATYPEVVVTGDIEIGPGVDTTGVNPANYHFAYTRGQASNAITQHCQTFRGVLNTQTGVCTLPPAFDPPCSQSAGHFMTGVDGAQRRVCQPSLLLNSACPKRSAVVGIDSAGGFTCGKF